MRKALTDPLLAEAFPETKRLHDLKTGRVGLPPGGIDGAAGLHAFEVSSELSRGAGRRLLLAHPKPQVNLSVPAKAYPSKEREPY